MRKNVDVVIEAWLCGKRAHSQRSRQTGDYVVSTDGKTVFSYKMPIARRLRNGVIELIERGRAPSCTTRSHVDAIRRQFWHDGKVGVRFVQTVKT